MFLTDQFDVRKYNYVEMCIENFHTAINLKFYFRRINYLHFFIIFDSVYLNFVAVAAENNSKDFLISVLCPEDWGSMAEETIDCGPDAVIDIVSARVTLLAFNYLCVESFNSIVDKIINADLNPCNVELPFLL